MLYRSDMNISDQCPNMSFVDIVPMDKLNICCNDSVVPNPSLIDLQSLTSLDSGGTVPSIQDPFLTSGTADWNVNYSKLCM